MGKKLIIGIIIIIILILVFWRVIQEKDKSIGLEQAKEVVSDWITNSAPTYVFDGSALTFIDAQESKEGKYELTFSFESSAAGYGDRTDEILAQVITFHKIEIVLENGQVVSAVTDGIYDEIKEEIIEETSPETMEIIIYFVEMVEGQEQVVAVERSVPYTVAVARASLEALLAGPLAHEEAEGLSSLIPEGTVLQNIAIENGLAIADFNEKLQEGVAGSAWVMAIRSQIEKTLLQFDTVDQVIIAINGRSEGILQP